MAEEPEEQVVDDGVDPLAEVLSTAQPAPFEDEDLGGSGLEVFDGEEAVAPEIDEEAELIEAVTRDVAEDDEPEETEEAAEEEEDAEEVTLTRKELDALMARVEQLSGGQPAQPTEQPQGDQAEAEQPQQQAAQQEPPPTYVPEIPKLELTDDEFEDLMGDREKFLDFQQKREEALATHVTQSVLRGQMPHIYSYIQQAMAASEASQRFFEEMPEARQYPNAAARAAMEVRSENPNATIDEVIAKTKEKLQGVLGVAQKIKNSSQRKVDTRPKRGQFANPGTEARTSRTRRRGNTTPTNPGQEAFEEMLQLQRDDPRAILDGLL